MAYSREDCGNLVERHGERPQRSGELNKRIMGTLHGDSGPYSRH